MNTFVAFPKLTVKTTSKRDNLNTFCKAKTKLIPFEEFQSEKNTIQSYLKQRSREIPFKLPQRRLQAHKKKVGVLKNLKNP